MNYLGVDYGEKRIGLATGDDEVGVAVPIAAAVSGKLEERLEQIGKEIRQRRVGAIVLGYPFNMDGTAGFKAREVDAFAAILKEKFALPIHRVDERLTSHQAEQELRVLSNSGRKRKTPRQQQQHRKTGQVDSSAAALILQDYLDSRTGLGTWDRY